MPIPTPNKNEEQKTFINRCAGMDSVVKEFPDQTQRVAVCFSQWRKSKKQDSIENIERSFVFRIDYSQKSKFRIDKTTGFLHAKARLTRSGVFDYYDEKGNLFREYRSDEEVFNKESVKSLELKPITNDHPDQLVTVDNVKSLQVGTIGEKIEKDGIYLSGNIVITDKDMVETVVNRKKAGLTTELSCGYSCNLISDIGIHDEDGYYTFKQQQIRYNHVGIVDKARAGSNVRIMDKKQNNNKGKESVMPEKIQFTRKAINLDSLKLDAITSIVAEDNLDLINTLSSKLDEAVDIILSEKKDKDELQGKFDQANETIKSLKEKIDSLSDINSPEIANMIKVRSDVEKIASELKVDCTDKDINTIKCDCIKSVSKTADLENKSSDYINARFDSVVEIINEQNKADGNNKFYNFMNKINDGKNKTIDDPRAAFVNKDKEQNRK